MNYKFSKNVKFLQEIQTQILFMSIPVSSRKPTFSTLV